MSAPKFERARGLSNVFNVSEEMTSHLKAVIAAILSAILMGGLCIFVRESDCSAQLCSFARFFVGASLMLCIVRRSFRFSSKAFGSGASIGLCILFYFLAIKSVPAGIAALLLYTGPIFAVAGESVLSRRMPPLRDLCLITVSVFGIVLVFRPTESTKMMTMLIGVSLLFDGIMNLVTVLSSVKIIDYQIRDDVIDTEFHEL